jgi:site-specific DNA recombinase
MFSVQDKLAGLRGVSLLRASTTKQTTGGDEKDIPAQREIVNEFMERNGIIKVKEFVEGGISAFKIKADDRDALNRIKAMADRKEFDILVVYYSDRIGRISEETPLVISYLNKRGILVYSVREGKISTESQLDKLMTYLTFWNNENESIKIRNRSTDYHILLIQNGKYRGGGERTLAYGYRLVNKGTKNAKGRNILDVEIDPETSKIVKLIYDLSVNYNIGSRAIASYLNENGYKDKAKNPKGWTYRAVTYILNNPIYKGVLRMYSKVRDEEIVCDKILEHLIIIPEDIWEKNQEAIKNRTTKGKPRKGITKSRVLLSGLVYCGHCGSKMYVWANHKHYTKKDGTRTNYVKDTYKCPAIDTRGIKKCDGQTTYSASKIDGIVETETKSFIKEISKKRLTDDFKKKLEETTKNLERAKKEKSEKIAELQQDILIMKKEIPKSLRGKSEFKPEELREMIDLSEKEIEGLLAELSELDDKINQNKSLVREYRFLDINLRMWEVKYNKGDMATKKALIASVVDKVIASRDNVEIKYKVTIDTFIHNSVEKDNYGSEIGQLARAHGSGP